jgi:hypothetical protein
VACVVEGIKGRDLDVWGHAKDGQVFTNYDVRNLERKYLFSPLKALKQVKDEDSFYHGRRDVYLNQSYLLRSLPFPKHAAGAILTSILYTKYLNAVASQK